jgi:hypothetical protein
MIYFFYGDEEFNISNEIKKFRSKLDKDFIEMSYKYFNNPKFPDLVTIHCAFESKHSGIAGQMASIICKLLLFNALQHLKDVSPPTVIKIESLLKSTF